MTKLYTVQELKIFFEAIDFLVEDQDFTPTRQQWSKVKEMVSNLVEPTGFAQQPVIQYRNPEPVVQTYQPPAQPERIGIADVIPVGNAAPTVFKPSDSIVNPTKTPNIDTANGTYVSLFAQ